MIMVRRLTAIIVAACTIAGCAGTQEPADMARAGAGSDRLAEKISAANRELERRFEAGDLPGVAAMYADDGMLLSAHGPRHEGREAIDAYWKRFETPMAWTLDVFSVEGTEEMAIQRGRSTMTRRLADGEVHTGVVEFLLIWRLEEDGEYRIVLDAYW